MDYEKTYEENIKFTKKHFNALYAKIQNANMDSIILSENNGNFNIEYKDENIYPDNSTLAISLQVSNFIKNPSSFFERPFIHKSIDNTQYIHDKYLCKLDTVSPFLLQDKIEFKGYKNPKNTIPYLIVFGIGTGQHILELIRQVDIRRIVIVDENFNILKLSMHITNWQEILTYFTQDERKIEFTVSSNAQTLAYTLINNIFSQNPFIFFYFNFFMHYRTEFFNKIESIVLDKVRQGFTGWGFFDDEIIGLKQTISNLKLNLPIYSSNKPVKKYKNKLSAFIIGSGPSIDDDIKYIKKHQDEVIIFSCGSALKVLYTNNIIPDYHVEMERNGRYELLTQSTDEEYIQQIILLGVNVIRSDSFEPFKSGKIFVRDSDTSSRLITNNVPHLDFCNPTAPNAALSVVEDLGIKNIFLFGLDMGFKSEENHHSKSSLYYQKGHRLSKFKETTTDKIKANFEQTGVVYTTARLEWAKQRLENCILHNEDLKCNIYNCSDGAFILGSTPVKSSDIYKHITNIDKKEALDLINKCFIKPKENSVYHDVNDSFTTQKKSFTKILQEIKTILSNKINNFYEFYKVLYSVYDILKLDNKKDDTTSMTFPLIKGTLASISARIYTQSLAYGDTKDTISYINKSFKIICEFLDEVENTILELKL